MIELSGSGAHVRQAFAGDTLNTALHLARLLPRERATISYVTALGDDPFSDAMRVQWHEEGIDTSLVATIPDALPGLYWIINDCDGERQFLYWRREAAARQLLRAMDDPAGVLARFDLLYLSGITLAVLPEPDRARLLEVMAHCRAQGVRIAFDPNYRPRLWNDALDARAWLGRAWALADIALTGRGDEAATFGHTQARSTIARLLAGGTLEIVITDAGNETVLATAEDIDRIIPPTTTVTDTTGAGDAFNAAYLAARILGADMRAAVRAGHARAASVVACQGAIPPPEQMPTSTNASPQQ